MLLLIMIFAFMPIAGFTGRHDIVNIIAATALILNVMLFCRYIVLTSVVWIINDSTICRIKGVFTKRTDYLELYRVIDYKESQSLLQKLFGIKTVTIISTDKTDNVMDIHGVSDTLPLVDIIRERVENCKKEKRIYEITNH